MHAHGISLISWGKTTLDAVMVSHKNQVYCTKQRGWNKAPETFCLCIMRHIINSTAPQFPAAHDQICTEVLKHLGIEFLSSCVFCVEDTSSEESSCVWQMQDHAHVEMCPQHDLFKFAGHVCFSFGSLIVCFYLQRGLPFVYIVFWSLWRRLH